MSTLQSGVISGPSTLGSGNSNTITLTGGTVTGAVYVTGGTFTVGTGTCTLASFSGDGGSGATGTLTVTANIAGAVAITAGGTNYTGAGSNVTSALGGSGCVGTVTLTPTMTFVTGAAYYAVIRTACGSAAAPCVSNPTGSIGLIIPPNTSLVDNALTGDGTSAPTIPSAGGYRASSFLNNDNTYTGWGNPGGSAGIVSLYLGAVRHMICTGSGNGCTYSGSNSPSVEGAANWGASGLGWGHVYTETTSTTKFYSGSGVNAIPACASGELGNGRWVSDATVNTPGSSYATGGNYTIGVECTLLSTGPTYTWLIH
jgi:hypothetical protein